jgi:hypothetical protein
MLAKTHLAQTASCTHIALHRKVSMGAGEIKDIESFKAWLATRPTHSRQQELLTIAHRSTLRLLPYAIAKWVSRLPVDGWLLAAMRCATSVRTSLLSGLLPEVLLYELITLLHQTTAATGDLSLRTQDDAKLSQALRTLAYVIEDFIPDRFEGGALSAIAYSCDLDLYVFFSNGNYLWQCVSLDAKEFSNGQDVVRVVNSELWPINVVPTQVAALNESSWAKALINGSVFVEWYSFVSKGFPIFNIRSASIRNTLERNIALGSSDGKFAEAFWKRNPAAINADISRWVEDARAEDAKLRRTPEDTETEVGTETLAEEDFQSRPASVETTVRNGKVVLLHETPHTDLPLSTAETAAADLAKALRQVAAEASAAQADQRFVGFMHNAAVAIDRAVHNQEQLFESGRNQKTLDAYSKTVDAEWNAILAARYHALIAQFAQTLNHFEAWRNFVAKPVSAAEQVKPEELAATAETVVEGLTRHSAVFANSVLQKLHWLVVRFRQKVNTLQADDAAHPMSAQVYEALQSDLAISLSNTLLSYVQSGLIRFGGKIADGAVSAADKIGNGVGYVAVIAIVGVSIGVLQRQYPGLYGTIVKAIKALRKLNKETDPN